MSTPFCEVSREINIFRFSRSSWRVKGVFVFLSLSEKGCWPKACPAVWCSVKFTLVLWTRLAPNIYGTWPRWCNSSEKQTRSITCPDTLTGALSSQLRSNLFSHLLCFIRHYADDTTFYASLVLSYWDFFHLSWSQTSFYPTLSVICSIFKRNIKMAGVYVCQIKYFWQIKVVKHFFYYFSCF